MVQVEQYQLPQRAPSAAAFWGYLERWWSLGAEVEASGCECPEWMRAAAILKLAPRTWGAPVWPARSSAATRSG